MAGQQRKLSSSLREAAVIAGVQEMLSMGNGVCGTEGSGIWRKSFNLDPVECNLALLAGMGGSPTAVPTRRSRSSSRSSRSRRIPVLCSVARQIDTHPRPGEGGGSCEGGFQVLGEHNRRTHLLSGEISSSAGHASSRPLDECSSHGFSTHFNAFWIAVADGWIRRRLLENRDSRRGYAES